MLLHINRLANDVLDAFAAAHDENDRAKVWSERRTVVHACEWLQQCPSSYIATSEVPYKNGGAKDPRVDLRVRGRGDDRPNLWVEFKPIWSGANYWNPSKFFDDIQRPTYDSKSVVLNDIDKMDRIPQPYVLNRFAFLLALETYSATEIELDETVPQPGSQLTPGQILYLATRRFRARAQECVDARRIWEGEGTAIHLVLFYYRYAGENP